MTNTNNDGRRSNATRNHDKTDLRNDEDTRSPSRDGATVAPSLAQPIYVVGLYGLLVGTGLCLVAFVTNPVPDPSFSWATLPASLQLPFEQPRIEHWPVTYTMGIWLWIVGFPALFLAGYRRFGTWTPFGSTTWLAGLPTLAMLGWTTYCRFFWPKLHPPTWNAPSYTFVCWLYCSSYDVVWSTAAYVIALFGIVATFLAVRRQNGDGYALLGFGFLARSLGLPAIYEGYRRTNRTPI